MRTDERVAVVDRSKAPVTIHQLFSGILPQASYAAIGNRVIRGVFDDSRDVCADSVFVAMRGAVTDGASFAQEAARRGAIAVIGEDLAPVDGAVTISTPDARDTLARLAARWHGIDDPETRASFTMLGVTGTNGKTTTAHMAQAIMRAAGRRCGMLGTVQYDLCGHSVSAGMTTPGPLTLCRHLREALDNGADSLVMEVSSHALAQRRVASLRFAAAAFTNLTQDHLDYHGTLDDYASAKAGLFDSLDDDAIAVINRDDEYAERMTRTTRARVVTYGMSGGADITGRIVRDTIAGTLFQMRLFGEELIVENALVGRHNVYNALAAAGLAHAAGANASQIEAGLHAVRNIPGRLQRVPGADGFNVFVDYAHTDDAIRNVVSVLRPITPGRLITLFGCGGDRDRTKRPRMAAAAASLSDMVIVTSDNPRTEDPQRIIDEIMPGFAGAERRDTRVEPDRRAAIFLATELAR
ncbi:MAG: UDP-N-acetylmuramoyl-L-alanyl-D-glutamate--2,6-diaminopimelate ligase, partial [Phycisphaerales bacterium]|nr:UDP-N-acetylmuramoyl-L-alanyl-D-glutamate--2,6-diaminopimelate ligase [Phycisphaerales bacterium]